MLWGGGVGEGSKEKGQISGGHSHFLMNNFITLALGQHLFLNFHPHQVGNEVDSSDFNQLKLGLC